MLSGSISTYKRSDRAGVHYLSLSIARFEYNDLGHRVAKHSYHPTTYQLTQSTFYLRDPSGRLLSVYQKTGTNPAYEKERYLYGMDMIGVMQMDATATQPGEATCEGCPPPPPPLSVGMGCTGQRMYYLKDQVGNVRVILQIPSSKIIWFRVLSWYLSTYVFLSEFQAETRRGNICYFFHRLAIE